MTHCVMRGCSSLSYVGAPLRTLFILAGMRRTHTHESQFFYLPPLPGVPTSALYRAGNLALLAPRRGSDPGLCSSHPNKKSYAAKTWQTSTGAFKATHAGNLEMMFPAFSKSKIFAICPDIVIIDK